MRTRETPSKADSGPTSTATPGFSLRWKTLAGLAAVSIVGGGLALVFSRPSQTQPAPPERTVQHSVLKPLPRGPGRIVPLMIEDTAAEPTRSAEPGRVQTLPAIRRPLTIEPLDPSPPQLSEAYPQPLSMLGISTLQPPLLDEPAAQPATEPDAAELPVTRDSVVPADQPLTSNPPATHKIVDGDTLESLAQRYFQDANRAEEIFRLNRDVLASPDLLPIGAVLKLPQR